VKKLQERGRDTVLPIVGDMVVEIRLSIRTLPAIVFRAPDGGESEITVEDCIVLRRGNQEDILEGSKPGTTLNPKTLGPLLELLESEVKDAVGEREGKLRIEFSNSLVMEVCCTSGYEAWHFQYPRPGRPKEADNVRHISLHGAHGRVI
jgi:hypothetical protein